MKTIDVISHEEYLKLENIANAGNDSHPTILTTYVHERMHENSGRKKGFIRHSLDDGLHDVYRLFCMPSRYSFSKDYFLEGIRSLPEINRKIYVHIDAVFITHDVKKILLENGKDYTIVRRD